MEQASPGECQGKDPGGGPNRLGQGVIQVPHGRAQGLAGGEQSVQVFVQGSLGALQEFGIRDGFLGKAEKIVRDEPRDEFRLVQAAARGKPACKQESSQQKAYHRAPGFAAVQHGGEAEQGAVAQGGHVRPNDPLRRLMQLREDRGTRARKAHQQSPKPVGHQKTDPGGPAGEQVCKIDGKAAVSHGEHAAQSALHMLLADEEGRENGQGRADVEVSVKKVDVQGGAGLLKIVKIIEHHSIGEHAPGKHGPGEGPKDLAAAQPEGIGRQYFSHGSFSFLKARCGFLLRMDTWQVLSFQVR